jgi:transposase-like protein
MFQFVCPVVGSIPQIQRRCKLCQSPEVVIKQTMKRPLKDSVLKEITVIRLFCKSCRYAFRVYPDGVREYSSRTKRLVFLGVVLYAAGLSYEKSAGFLQGMCGRRLESFVSIWRDVQRIGEKLRRKKNHLFQKRGTSVVVGMDGTYVRVRGKEQPVLVATNMSDGTTITVSLGNEWQEKELHTFLIEVGKEIGIRNITGIVTDDLDMYKHLCEKRKILHQVCLAHLKKNLKQRLHKIQKTIPTEYIMQISSLFSPLSNTSGTTLAKLKKDPNLWQKEKDWVLYRGIVGDLVRDWPHYAAWLTDPTLPQTNNKTEQAIGRSKVRYKTTRGFKSQPAVLNFFTLTQIVGMHQFEKLASVC